MSHRKRAFRTLAVAGGLAALCLIGCEAKRRAKPSPRPTVPRAAVTWETPTDEECRQFAASLEDIVRSGDIAAFNEAIDWDAILESATGGIEGVEKARRGFIADAKRLLGARGSLGQQVIEQAAKGGSYRLLRVRTQGDEKRALFRFLFPQAGVNYYDLILVRQPDGKVKAVDIYVFASAERVSKTFRRAFIPLAAEASKSVLAKLTGEENEYVKNLGNTTEMADAVRSGRYHRALDIYGKLPASLRRDKTLLVLRLQAALQVGEEEYRAAIDAFRRFHPKDPCVDIISIDKHILTQRYDQALVCIDRLDAAVGGDPYLNVLRAGVNLGQKKFQAARELANKAIAAEETLVSAYWALVTISLAEKDFDETSRLLNTLEEKFKVKLRDLNQVPEYAEYVKSPQYQEWLKSRSRRGK